MPPVTMVALMDDGRSLKPSKSASVFFALPFFFSLEGGGTGLSTREAMCVCPREVRVACQGARDGLSICDRVRVIAVTGRARI